MTPAELKAKELIEWFYQYMPAEEEYELPFAKKCATKVCDEQIKEIDDNFDSMHASERKEFYNQVKTAIKNYEQ